MLGRWEIDLICFTDEETGLERLPNYFLSRIMVGLGLEPSVHLTLLQSSTSVKFPNSHVCLGATAIENTRGGEVHSLEVCV